MRTPAMEHLVLVFAVPLLFTAVMLACGQWTLYAHENAYVGIKFAPSAQAGCGADLLTNDGRDTGLDTFYCE